MRTGRHLGIALLTLCGAGFPAFAQERLMPLPAQLEKAQGSLAITPGFALELAQGSDAELLAAKQRFYKVLSRQTGITVWDTSHPAASIRVLVDQPGNSAPRLGDDESYDLTLAKGKGTLHAATSEGALHGLQTILQLAHGTSQNFELPAVQIHDEPRFAWRGLMLDCSRHFMPVEEIKHTLDGMEAVKLNVFHWHLSDDQGFRAEIKSLPLLTEHGSDGNFYTQTEMREVVEYARNRGIRVVPEIDVPAHTSALLAAYPAIGSGPGPYVIERKWGIFNPALDPTNEATYSLLDKIIGELAAIFPDTYFHIGGDECNGKEWKANPHIQAFMREHHLDTTDALQAYFSGRVQKLIAAHGKIAIGWDEILQPGIDRKVVVQSWHGSHALAVSAAQGHLTLLSKGYYLDLNLPAGEHYMTDPLGGEAAALPDAQKRLVVGGEAAMWTEYVSTETVEDRIWPRAAAIAERLWSPAADTQDVANMYERLADAALFLEAHRIDNEASRLRMLQRISGPGQVADLDTLAQVEEPPKQHDRAKIDPTNAFTPLNRLVDVIPAESERAREFGLLCNSIAAGTATATQKDRGSELLHAWAEASARLSKPNAANASLAEIAGPAAALKDAAEIGLRALEYLKSKTRGDRRWRESAVTRLAVDASTHADVTLAIAPSIARLVEAASDSK